MLPLVRFGRHLAADLAVQVRRVDRLDLPDPLRAVAQRVERGRFAAPEGGDDADAGDGDASHGRKLKIKN